MSLDPLSAARSPAADGPPTSEFELSLPSLVKLRGLALIEGLERHQPGAAEHADATAAYSFATAVEMGFERSQADLLREAAKLHEVGKVYVPPGILAKPEPELSDGERAILGSHFEAGAGVARGAGIPETVCAWILRAGERFDGGGPKRLSGEGIPIESRIIRAACAVDGSLSTRSRPSNGHDRRLGAIALLRAEEGSQFDPAVAEALAGILERAA